MRRLLICYDVGIMGQAISPRRPEPVSLVSGLQRVGAPISPTVLTLNVSSLCPHSEVFVGERGPHFSH